MNIGDRDYEACGPRCGDNPNTLVRVFRLRASLSQYTYRYRLSVEVGTPDGLRTGSSVIEVRYETFPDVNGRNHVSRIFGEAIFVDLGQGKNLIALLAAGPSGEDVDYPGRIVFVAFNLDGNDPDTPKRLPQLRGKRNLDIDHSSLYEVTKRFLPTFVTLTDLTNPSTVRVAPFGLFDETFGASFKLRTVAIEMTTDPITKGIENKIPWIGNFGLETAFERQLRGTNAGSSLTPGLNLKRRGP